MLQETAAVHTLHMVHTVQISTLLTLKTAMGLPHPKLSLPTVEMEKAVEVRYVAVE